MHRCAPHRLVSHVVVVMVDPQTQVRRLMARDGVEESAAASRIASQMPLESKAARASQVIDNSGSPEATRSQVRGCRAPMIWCAPAVHKRSKWRGLRGKRS